MQLAIAAIFIVSSIMLLRINEKWKWPLAAAYLVASVYLTLFMRAPMVNAVYSTDLGYGLREAIAFNGSMIKSLLLGKATIENWSSLEGIILNILMFIPVGYLAPLIFKSVNKWWKATLVGFLFSLAIEITQLVTHLGFAEVDDLFNNTLGALVGWVFYLNFISIPLGQTRPKIEKLLPITPKQLSESKTESDIYEINPRERKQYLKQFLHRQKRYRVNLSVGIVLYVVSLVIVCGFTVLFTVRGSQANNKFDIPAPIIGALMGLAVGVTPFIIGQSIIATAKRGYGRPFSERSKEFIKLEADGLSYGYHPTRDASFEEMIVYQIPYQDIRGIHFDQDTKVLTILGRGTITVFDDLLMTCKSNDRSGKILHEGSAYQIMLANKSADQLVKLIEEKIARRQDIE